MLSRDAEQALHIRKLSLVVTERCNLRCVYCYARLSGRWNHGTSMSESIADEIIQKGVVQSKRCDFIQFFGGEPTLNLAKVEYISEKLERLADAGEIKWKPRLGIVTNGVFENHKRTCESIKKFNIETTISIDGPEKINAITRKISSGASTYPRIIRTIMDMIEADIPITAELVYTAQHIEHGISIVDCLEFLQNIGINKVIFQSANPPAGVETTPFHERIFSKYLEYYMQAVDWWFENLTKDYCAIDIYFKDLLKMMLGGTSTLLSSGCPAGVSDFSIGPDGSVYPCQLLYGNPMFYAGDISDVSFQLLSQKIPLIHDEFARCKSCFARHWCQPCAALNDFFGNITAPPLSECTIRKSVILRIAQWADKFLSLPSNEFSRVLQSEIHKLP